METTTQKTTITVDRDVFENAAVLRQDAADKLNCNVDWNAVIQSMCVLARQQRQDYLDGVRYMVNTEEVACTVCGLRFATERQLKRHTILQHMISKNPEGL